MSGILKISEAASLALHSMYLLGKSDANKTTKQMSTQAMADELDISVNHLAKVMQQLTKAGLVKSIRGPSGGFVLAKPANKIALMNIYEAVSGTVEPKTCLLKKPVCKKGCCLLGGLLQSIDRQVIEQLSKNKLSDFIGFNN